MIHLIVIALSMVVNPSTAHQLSAGMVVQQRTNGDYSVRYATEHSTHHTAQRWENPARFYSDEGAGAPMVSAKHW